MLRVKHTLFALAVALLAFTGLWCSIVALGVAAMEIK